MDATIPSLSSNPPPVSQRGIFRHLVIVALLLLVLGGGWYAVQKFQSQLEKPKVSQPTIARYAVRKEFYDLAQVTDNYEQAIAKG
ncbi:MAG: hypothetical protein AAB972_04570, partial [Patescibacteria group bacterium]